MEIVEIKKSNLKCPVCGNNTYEEFWGDNDRTFVCYVCKRKNEINGLENRKEKKNENFIKCAELLQGIIRTEYEEILTDIRDYLVECKEKWQHQKCEIDQIIGFGVEVFVDKALADLTEYAEKLGVELRTST